MAATVTVSINRGEGTESVVSIDAKTGALVTTKKHEEATRFTVKNARRVLKLIRKHHKNVKRIMMSAGG